MISIAVCDDDLLYQEIIVYKIQRCMKEKFKADCKIKCFNSLSDLKQYIDSNKVDIAFFDIMVNDENSMNWSIENITGTYTQMIFMTSFPQSAYNISEANCCYYLVKSRINEENLSKALKCALDKITKKDKNITVVKSGSKNRAINYHDILYIECLNNNLVLKMKNGEDIAIYSTLKDFSKNLPLNFLRCHKSYIVNMNDISSYEPYKFTLKTDIEIPIPPKKYKSITKEYESYLINV